MKNWQLQTTVTMTTRVCTVSIRLWIRQVLFSPYRDLKLIHLVLNSPSSLAKAPIRFPPLPLGGFRQVLNTWPICDWHRSHPICWYWGHWRCTNSLVCVNGAQVGYMTKYWATYKPYSPLIFDANDVCCILAECLKSCLNPPRGRGGKRIGAMASEDGIRQLSNFFFT